MLSGNNLYLIVALTFFLVLTYVFMSSLLLLRLANYFREKRQNKFTSLWQDEVLDYLTSQSDPKTIVARIPKSSYPDLIFFLASFFLHLKGEDLEQLKKLVTESDLKTYFIKNLKNFRKKKRVEAIYFLRFVKGDDVVNLLAGELGESNEMIFRTAVESLAYLDAVTMIDQILDAAKSRKQFTGDSILSMIIKFDRTICEPLTKRLAIEKDYEIQQIIITVLWHFKYAEALDVILKILVYSGNKALILESIRYLGEIENIDSVNSLRFFLNHSRADIRAAAIRAISKIGDTSNEDKIIKRINDKDLEVKIAAAYAMYNGSRDAKSKLFELAWNSPNKEVSTVANRIILEKRILENA
ncbi:MAG: HEAT repeat domain-containing protein [Bacteroidota bacterium]